MNFFWRIIYKTFPSWIYYHVAYFVKNRRLKQFNKIFNNKKTTTLIFYNLKKKTKKKKKIFIFGSGSSINELNHKNFKEVNNHHSIGINNWIFHQYITTYYMIELSYDNSWNDKVRLRIIYLLKNKIKKPIFLIHKGKCSPKKIKHWMKGMSNTRVFLYEYLRPDTFKRDKENQFIKTLNYISKKNRKSNVITLGIGATIERSISLCLSLAYSQIILLGVDLYNTKMFWNNRDKNFKGIMNLQSRHGYHKTATKRFGRMPVQKSILILDKIARQYYNSKILIATNKSLLSSKLEKYEWLK
jgi:hypothetical protein